MQLAFEYCDKTPISWLNRLFVSLKEIRIGAFKSGYQAAMKQYDIALIEEKIKRESKEVLMQMIKQRSEDWNNK